MDVSARDRLEDLPSQAWSPNLWAESPPNYQMCHSAAKTSALPGGSFLSRNDSRSAGGFCIGGQLRGKEGGKKACISSSGEQLQSQPCPLTAQKSTFLCLLEANVTNTVSMLLCGWLYSYEWNRFLGVSARNRLEVLPSQVDIRWIVAFSVSSKLLSLSLSKAKIWRRKKRFHSNYRNLKLIVRTSSKLVWFQVEYWKQKCTRGKMHKCKSVLSNASFQWMLHLCKRNLSGDTGSSEPPGIVRSVIVLIIVVATTVGIFQVVNDDNDHLLHNFDDSIQLIYWLWTTFRTKRRLDLALRKR